MEVKRTGCCGVIELVDISTITKVEDMFKAAVDGLQSHTGDFHRSYLKPFVYFTGVIQRIGGDHASSRRDNYAEAFADYIEAGGYGTVNRAIPAMPNPATGNLIQMFVWLPDYDAVKKFWREGMARREEARLAALNAHAAALAMEAAVKPMMSWSTIETVLNQR